MSFTSFLDKVGHDFKVVFDKVIPIAAGAGEIAVSLLAPSLGPLFNTTVNAVITAEQNASAIGKQAGSGPIKLAAVVQLMGPLIATALKDAGKDSSTAAVEGYINSIVTILNALPASSSI